MILSFGGLCFFLCAENVEKGCMKYREDWKIVEYNMV